MDVDEGEDKSVDVKFSNLPKDFYENLFLSQLRGKLHLKRRARSSQKDTLSCVYDKKRRTVVVRFASPELASRIAESKKLEFFSTTLHVERQPSNATDDAMYEQDTESEDEIVNNNQAEDIDWEVEYSNKQAEDIESEDEYDNKQAEEDIINSPVRKKIDLRSTPIKNKLLTKKTPNLNSYFKNLSFIPQLTKEVKASKLPEDFIEVNVLFVINNVLYQHKFCERTVKPATVCKKTGPSTAIIEFISVEAATKICTLIVEYGDVFIKLEQVEIDPEPTQLPTSSVNVSGLPMDFEVVNVLFVLNSALHKSKFCERTIKPAKDCKKTGDSTAVVEFTSVEAATKICTLNVDYGDVAIKMEQAKIDPEPTPLPVLTSSVNVSRLPIDFEVVNVLFVLNSALHKSKFCERTIKPAKDCKKTGDSTAVVEFTSVEAATKICTLNVDYGDVPIEVEQVEIHPDTTPLLELTSSVNVSGLPMDFEEVNVLFVMNEALYAQNFCKRPEKPAEACKKIGDTTATVEFSSVAAATEICSGLVFYGEDLLLLEQTSAAPKQSDYASMSVSGPNDWNDTDVLQLSKVKCSDTVQITGITSSYTSDTFKKFLFKEMKEANFLSEDDLSAIVKCNYNSSTKTAVVKFSTSEEATLATYLSNLKVTKLVLDDNGNECVLCSDEEGEQGQLHLEDDEGFKYFLKVLARKRGDIPKSGSHDNFLDTLTGYMEKRGVKTDICEMRKKKASMRENFRRWKVNNNELHPLFNVHSVIFDPAVKQSILKGSVYEWKDDDENLLQEPEGSDKFLDDLIKFSDSSAASWSNNSEFALVQACIDNKTEYNKPRRHINFWRLISADLYRQRFIYGPQKCEDKMESLTKMYKDYCDEAGATGAVGPFEMIRDQQTRDLMELMHELMRKDVGCHPQHIQGAGIQLVHQRESPEGTGNALSRGRTRPSSLPREEGTGTAVARGRTRPSSLPRDKSMKDIQFEVAKEKLSLIKKMNQKLDES